MADNIYLLETRLSKNQQAALSVVREIARAKGLTVFLVGGAVRDLIGGTAVRDLDVAVQGNALKLKKDIEKAGGFIAGERDATQAFYVRFPGGVRVEVGSTLAVTYPKPGKAVVKPANILEDLRRRDFTANAMALSLNEGSYGLLMDPLNGVADIENRQLRLVSNYGFIEDPVRMIRAARYMARLGWGMDEKTQARYETGKTEGYISALDEFHRGYETEEIFHEEDALRVIRRLEEEGWMQHLFPALSAGKANVSELERLRESQAQLQMQGVVADGAAAGFPLLTAKMSPKEVEALKRSFPRQGFVDEIEELEGKGKEFAAQLSGKGAALPSQAYTLITAAEPEVALWVAHTTKSGGLQAKFKSFSTEWPQARQRIPYVMMQEMRIHPDLPDYESLVDKLFFQLMDGKLGTPEEMKAFLEPYSPPAPPPPISLRRPRAPKKEAKQAKSRKKAVDVAEGESGALPESADTGAAATVPAPTPVAVAPAAAVGKPEKAAKPAPMEKPIAMAGKPAKEAQGQPPKKGSGGAVKAKAVDHPVKTAGSSSKTASQTAGKTATRGSGAKTATVKTSAKTSTKGSGAKTAAKTAAAKQAKRPTPAKATAKKPLKKTSGGKAAKGVKPSKAPTGRSTSQKAAVRPATKTPGSKKAAIKKAPAKGVTAGKKAAPKGAAAAAKRRR